MKKSLISALMLGMNFQLTNAQTKHKHHPLGAIPYERLTTKPHFGKSEQDLTAYLKTYIRYPEADRENITEGKTVVGLIINEQGKAGNVTIAKSSGSKTLDAEALRVAGNMQEWQPGKYKGKTVSCYYLL